MSILHYDVVFEKLARAVGDGAADEEDYPRILREVDEVAELKKSVLDVTEPPAKSHTTT